MKGKTKMASKKMMRGGMAAKTSPKRMRGGGMMKAASKKKMMRGGMAKKKMGYNKGGYAKCGASYKG